MRSRKAELIRKQNKPSAWELGKELFGKYSSGQGNLSLGRKTFLKEKITTKDALKRSLMTLKKDENP